jgi:tRNA (cmo5U34)-methyltransferase
MNSVWSETDSQVYQTLASIAVPERAVQMAVMLVLLPIGPTESARVVELCCGEGRLAASILRCFPNVQVLALDGSAEMRGRAEQRLAQFGARAQVGGLDLAATDWWSAMNGVAGVVSSLAIHHLAHSQKQRLFDAVAQRLSPRGALLIADLVEPKRREAHELFAATWDAAAEANAAAANAPDMFRQFNDNRWNYFRYPDPADTPSHLFDQLCWLRNAGFAAVDCFWLSAGHAIYGGYKHARASHPQLPYHDALAVAMQHTMA